MSHELLGPVKRKLERAKRARDLEKCLYEVVEIMTQLDASMIAGQIVPTEVKKSAYLEATQLAKAAFAALAVANRARAEQWVSGLAIYQRPRELDLEELKRAIQAGTAATPVDIERAPMSAPLREQLRVLRSLTTSDPNRHRLHPPASAREIDEREKELGVRIPDDVKTLYRLCSGFALFRHDDSYDKESSPFRFVPLHELQTYRGVSGEDDEKPIEMRPGQSLEAVVAHPDRLQVFDLGNGDFLSCVCAADFCVWIDDWRESPTSVAFRSVADILSVSMAPDRLDATTGRWSRP